MSKRVLLAAAGCLALIAGGLAIVWLVIVPSPPSSGGIDTDLSGVTTVRPTRTHVSKPTHRAPEADRRCWNEFGGDPQRSLSRLASQLGIPTKPLWARAMGSYMEYPPSYCDGRLYVNTFGGRTVALEAQTGKIIWSQGGAAAKASTPAIAGQRLIVTSHDGTVTAFDRENGHRLWQLRTNAKVESSPVALGNTVYFGVTNGRLFAVNVATGSVRWAYNTGGRINSSPSVWGNRICISTYAGSILCLNRTNGTQALEQVLQARLLPLRELLCEPVDGRQADLLRRPLRKGLRALRRQRRHAVDRSRRLARLHDAGGRSRPRVRRRLRRRPPRLQREDRPGALAAHGAADGSSAHRSSSATSSSSRRSSRRTYAADTATGRSTGRSGWASTRPASRPTATTTSR